MQKNFLIFRRGWCYERSELFNRWSWELECNARCLGPIVVENVMVTRHLFQLQPESVEEGFRPVSAIRPGVMGITGIETSDVIYGIIENKAGLCHCN